MQTGHTGIRNAQMLSQMILLAPKEGNTGLTAPSSATVFLLMFMSSLLVAPNQRREF